MVRRKSLRARSRSLGCPGWQWGLGTGGLGMTSAFFGVGCHDGLMALMELAGPIAILLLRRVWICG